MDEPAAAGPPAGMGQEWSLRPLAEKDLGEASVLMQTALPYDRISVVAREKLFGDNGTRAGRAIGAMDRRTGRLLGVLAQAGRWIKVLAVQKEERGRGIGGALLEDARRALPKDADARQQATPLRLRIGDHPGNYLSPGIDERYQEGRTFFLRRGFHEVGRVQNLRALVRQNPLVTQDRALELREQAASLGYVVRRAKAADASSLLAMIGREFARVWALEVARAMAGDGVHAAFLPSGEPVAFAAHDGNNRGLGWFGPMGTLTTHRGKRLGEALLLACLLDVSDRPEGGTIAWVGPVEFYRRACGARMDREFVVYEEA